MQRGVGILGWSIAGVASFVAGAAAAWVATGTATAVDGRGPGPWRTSSGTGGADATAFQRATIARTGIWALPASEVVYFIAERDDAGRPLSARCSYTLTGRGRLPARWWSIGAYVDYHWVPNTANRYSYTQSNVARAGDGSYTIHVSPRPQAGNWLPLGQLDGKVTLLT